MRHDDDKKLQLSQLLFCCLAHYQKPHVFTLLQYLDIPLVVFRHTTPPLVTLLVSSIENRDTIFFTLSKTSHIFAENFIIDKHEKSLESFTRFTAMCFPSQSHTHLLFLHFSSLRSYFVCFFLCLFFFFLT